jgi:hypothetical protein
MGVRKDSSGDDAETLAKAARVVSDRSAPLADREHAGRIMTQRRRGGPSGKPPTGTVTDTLAATLEGGLTILRLLQSKKLTARERVLLRDAIAAHESELAALRPARGGTRRG